MTSSTVTSIFVAISSVEGERFSSVRRFAWALPMRYSRLACFWGRRNAPLWSDSAWMIAWRTHHTA